MDSYIQLALIEKSKRVFADDPSTFLSFPLLSPLSYKPEAIASITAPATAADYLAAADFARAANFVPRDMVANMSGERFLWDVYDDVITRAVVATGDIGDVGANKGSILYDVAADGSRTETAAYSTYRQYRDAWIVAREAYAAHKLTGEMATDTAAKEHWTNVEEPAMREALARAEEDFRILGKRDEIEAALRAETAAAMSNPVKRWKEWADDFNPDIDLLTDPAGGRFAPTGISPRDFATNVLWPRFDMSADEMARLIAEAPAKLKGLLQGQDGGNVDHISFEFRSVGLVRPWFHASALTSKIWTSKDPELMLSDGADPPSGICPAYVSAIIFVRGLRIARRLAKATEWEPGNLRFTLQVQASVQDPRRAEAGPVLPSPVNRPINPATVRAFDRVDARAFRAAQSRPTSFAAPQIASAAGRLTTAEIARAGASAIKPRAVLVPRRAVPIEQTPAPPRSATNDIAVPAANAAGQIADSNEISVLAFICKRLPKAPDADQSLRWSS